MNFEIFMFYFISIYAKKVEIKSADKLKLYNKNNIVIIIILLHYYVSKKNII